MELLSISKSPDIRLTPYPLIALMLEFSIFNIPLLSITFLFVVSSIRIPSKLN